MCLVAFSFSRDPKPEFTMVSNRDEFFERETRSIHYWENEPWILGGRDMQAGGTWLGVNQFRDIAFLTNFRDPKYFGVSKKSRGDLVADFLRRKYGLEEFLSWLRNNKEDYNGYNLVFGNPDDKIFYYSNVNDKLLELQPGLYGLSNSFLNTSWPKLEYLKSEFEKYLKTENLNKSAIIKVLANNQEADYSELPSTGVPLEMEKKLSAPFIRMDKYGTRCSSILNIEEKSINFFERTYEPNPESFSDKEYSIFV